jgi:hypothetical protein
MDSLETLKNYKFIYLATPYTKYYLGQENAANDAAKVVAKLLSHKVYVYSPIVHTHQVAIHGNLDLKDHSIWLPFDQPFLDAADLLLVCMMPGWKESYGVKFEMDDFKAKKKTMIFLNPDTLELTKFYNDIESKEVYYGH